jgi:hypothetical protein
MLVRQRRLCKPGQTSVRTTGPKGVLERIARPPHRAALVPGRAVSRREITVGGRAFPSKKAALAAVRAVLNNTPLFLFLDGEDLALIRGLLDLHPEREEEIPGMPPTRGFHIVRKDGSTIDFSIYTPFESETRRRLNNIGFAARQAVRDITNSFKSRRFGDSETAPCELTGNALRWDDAVVDHAGEWPFSRILTEWIERRGAEPPLVDRGLYGEFEPDAARDFCEFHNERAKLRLIHKMLNCSIGARGDR